MIQVSYSDGTTTEVNQTIQVSYSDGRTTEVNQKKSTV